MYYLIFHSSIVQNIYQPAEASAQNENCRPFIHFRQQGRAPLTNRQRADILLRRGNIDGQRKPRIGGAYLEQLPEQLRIPVRSLDKNLRLPLAGRTPIIRKSKCSTDFKRNDFLKKNEAYPLGALRSLKFAYRKLRISLFVELAV